MKIAKVIVRLTEDEDTKDSLGIAGEAKHPVFKYLGESMNIRNFTGKYQEGKIDAAEKCACYQI